MSHYNYDAQKTGKGFKWMHIMCRLGKWTTGMNRGLYEGQTEICTSRKQHVFFLIVAPRLHFTTPRHPDRLFSLGQMHGRHTEKIIFFWVTSVYLAKREEPILKKKRVVSGKCRILFIAWWFPMNSVTTRIDVKTHPNKKVISHFFLQLVSQDSVQELFERTIAPYLGFSRIEFQFCCLLTRFVSQGVVCLHSVGFGGSWTFTVILFNVSCGSTLFVSLYISFD
jgi:hypothetical protein